MADEKNFPEPHASLPDKVKKEWTKTYATAFKQAQADHPEDESAQHQAARREANRLLRVPKPENYKDAMALEDWQVIYRAEVSGELLLVTIDGNKYRFTVPAKKSETAK